MSNLKSILKNEKINLPKAVRKRNNHVTEFDLGKITDAISYAFESVGVYDKQKAEQVTIETLKMLSGNGNIPEVDEINNLNVKALESLGYSNVARSFEQYAKKRREVRVLGSGGGGNTTDSFLMVSSLSHDSFSPWDREKIRDSLIKEADVDYETAKHVAKSVENKLITSKYPSVTTDLIREIAKIELIDREQHNSAEMYTNISIPRTDLEKIILNKNDENSNIQGNNPEAVNFTLAGIIGKKYALSKVFDKEVAEAHSKGVLHNHDLDMPTRFYCSAHSLAYLEKFGLKLDNLQTSSSPPKHTETLTGHLNTFFAAMQAYYAGALGVGHFNIMYAPLIQSDLEKKGEKRIGILKNQIKNIKKNFTKSEVSAKNLDDILKQEEKNLLRFEKDPISILSDEEIDKFMKQRGQEAIYAASQNAFSRGGQTLFIDFNIHTGIPDYLKNTPAILPGGKYGIKRNNKTIFLEERKLKEKTASGYNLIELVDPKTNKTLMKERVENKELLQDWFLEKGESPITYRDYDKISKRFTKNLLKVWEDGDEKGQPFAFPKCDLHIDKDTFKDPEQKEILEQACKVASENGSPYFVFDRDEVSLSACCRLRTKVEDNYVLKHPESMRFCGFQNVTINLPQAAYRTTRKNKKNLEGFLEEVDKTMGLAVKAHLQKKEFIESLQKKGLPQWQTGQKSLDGQPYIDTNKATYILGLIGLNEAVQYLTGKELHEMNTEEFKNTALKTVAHMNIKSKEYGKKYGLKFSLEESPAESASRRLSKTDLVNYPESKKFVKGSIEKDQTYYSNSIHPRADAPISLIERIELQGKFHSAIESGAITHAFVGEEKPDPLSIYSLVKKTFENTQTAQLTISPEYTSCKECGKLNMGLIKECKKCGNDDPETLKGMTRIVGYYSLVDNWNESKLEELKAREKGNYSLKNSKLEMKIPELENPHKGITAISIGKSNCPLCEDLQSAMKYKGLAKKYGKEFNIIGYEADSEEGLTNAMLANVNLSQLPALIVLDKNSNEIYRGSTIGSNGKTIPINTKEVENSIKKYLESNK